MAVDQFIKLTAIDGESVDAKHAKDIDVLAWSWGLSNSGSAHVGGGAGSGKVNVQDLSFTKYIDSATHLLNQHCATGKHIPEAKLVVRKAGDKPLEYLKITLKDILVTSVSTGGSGGEDRLTENVSLNFAEYKIEYTPQKKDGSGDAAKEFAFHIAKNAKV